MIVGHSLPMPAVSRLYRLVARYEAATDELFAADDRGRVTPPSRRAELHRRRRILAAGIRRLRERKILANPPQPFRPFVLTLRWPSIDWSRTSRRGGAACS